MSAGFPGFSQCLSFFSAITRGQEVREATERFIGQRGIKEGPLTFSHSSSRELAGDLVIPDTVAPCFRVMANSEVMAVEIRRLHSESRSK